MKQKIFSLIFIFIFTFSAIFSGVQNSSHVLGQTEGYFFSGATNTVSSTVFRSANTVRTDMGTYLNDKSQNSLIRMASGKVTQNTVGTSKRTSVFSNWLFPVDWHMDSYIGIWKCFLLFVCLAMTYSMKWIIQYIHHKNGVKFSNLFCSFDA